MSENRPESEPVPPESEQQPQSPYQQPGQPQQGQWDAPNPYAQQPPGQQPPPQPSQPQDPYAVRQPEQPWGQQPQNRPQQLGQPWGQQPQNPYQQQQSGQPQSGQPWGQQPQSPYQQPGQPWGQQPQNPYQQPGQPQPGQPWNSPNPYGDPYGAPGGAVPPKKRSLTWLWILLAVVALAIVGAVVLIINLLSGPDSGDLYSGCFDGDAQSCNDLFYGSPAGSTDEDFGRTCGGRSGGWDDCNDVDMTAPANSWTEPVVIEPEEDDAQEPDGDSYPDVTDRAPLSNDDPTGCMMTACEEGMAYGDSARMDNLYDHCDAGDMVACDDLYFLSQEGSVYEEMGATCGSPGTNPGVVWCDPSSAERWLN